MLTGIKADLCVQMTVKFVGLDVAKFLPFTMEIRTLLM